ncbi:hypothetical protein [uncultured Algimonas sp.]|uniref:hypothetical protein n=1 Tax=uncultured Algimonas sp. TaxID=1547920 RepID=UPI00261F9DA0|nr:hypothetical protein [uncultured Algimonas sp.]
MADDDTHEAGEIIDRRHSLFTYVCWALLVGSALFGLVTASWNMVFLACVVFMLTLLPFFLESWTDLRLPRSFIGAVTVFVVGTIFLGEVGNFYERFWWWDIFMHTGSAIGFGMIGTVVMLIFVRGDRLSAPPLLCAIMAFSFAVSIGALWEIFEFGMDQFFGLNMQKDGLFDTMTDLIVDSIGAFIGAGVGYWYLKRGGTTFLPLTIEKFVQDNPHVFDSEAKATPDAPTGKAAGTATR